MDPALLSLFSFSLGSNFSPLQLSPNADLPQPGSHHPPTTWPRCPGLPHSLSGVPSPADPPASLFWSVPTAPSSMSTVYGNHRPSAPRLCAWRLPWSRPRWLLTPLPGAAQHPVGQRADTSGPVSVLPSSSPPSLLAQSSAHEHKNAQNPPRDQGPQGLARSGADGQSSTSSHSVSSTLQPGDPDWAKGQDGSARHTGYDLEHS